MMNTKKTSNSCSYEVNYFRPEVRRLKIPIFDEHRLPWTGGRSDIPSLSGSGKSCFPCILA